MPFVPKKARRAQIILQPMASLDPNTHAQICIRYPALIYIYILVLVVFNLPPTRRFLFRQPTCPNPLYRTRNSARFSINYITVVVIVITITIETVAQHESCVSEYRGITLLSGPHGPRTLARVPGRVSRGRGSRRPAVAQFF